MPRQIGNLKQFLAICRRRDVRCVKIKKNPAAIKFKVRCSKYLYTLVVQDKKKAEKIQKSIHESVRQVDVTARKHRKKRATQATK